jgi:hypothetical protein
MDDKMGGICSRHGDKKSIQKLSENLKGRDHLGYLNVYGRLNLKMDLK